MCFELWALAAFPKEAQSFIRFMLCKKVHILLSTNMLSLQVPHKAHHFLHGCVSFRKVEAVKKYPSNLGCYAYWTTRSKCGTRASNNVLVKMVQSTHLALSVKNTIEKSLRMSFSRTNTNVIWFENVLLPAATAPVCLLLLLLFSIHSLFFCSSSSSPVYRDRVWIWNVNCLHLMQNRLWVECMESQC